MKQYLDLKTWNRAAHFEFFRQFDEPFFGITANVDCTHLFQRVKEANESFFLRYLHCALIAANEIPAFRYRIEGDQVVEYATVNVSPALPRSSGAFGFAYFDFDADFATFALHAQREMERVDQTTGLSPANSNENTIHATVIPWVHFTGFSHARHFAFADSIPKMAFGKFIEQNGRKQMPISLHLHHAVADGQDAGVFFERLQALFDAV